jgi:GGDEF domain-containing protein
VDPRDLRRAVQEEIQEVLRGASARGPQLVSQLVGLGSRHGIEPFRSALFLLASVDRPEPDARALLGGIDAHRVDLESHLDRDPGLLVAALDYLEQQRPGDLGQPVFRASRPSATPGAVPAGLLDAEEWRVRLGDEMRRGERFGHPVAAILFAPDRPPAGDGWLPACAVALHEAARDTDQVALLPAERCGALLPCTRAPEAILVTERLRRALAAVSGLSWSAGVAVCEDRPWSEARILQQAERALLEVLRSGVATSRLYHPERRGHPRRPVGPSLEATLRGGGPDTEIVVEDLSLGGALIACPRRVPSGHAVELALREASPRSQPLRLASRVVRELPAALPEGAQPFRAALVFLGDATDRLRIAALLADLRGPARAAGETGR